MYFLGGGLAILVNAIERDELKEAKEENWGLGFMKKGSSHC